MIKKCNFVKSCLIFASRGLFILGGRRRQNVGSVRQTEPESRAVVDDGVYTVFGLMENKQIFDDRQAYSAAYHRALALA